MSDQNQNEHDRESAHIARLAARHGARLQPSTEDVGVTFLCCGRVYCNGHLYILLASPSARLLLRQPKSLEVVSDRARVSFTADLKLVLTHASKRQRTVSHDP